MKNEALIQSSEKLMQYNNEANIKKRANRIRLL